MIKRRQRAAAAAAAAAAAMGVAAAAAPELATILTAAAAAACGTGSRCGAQGAWAHRHSGDSPCSIAGEKTAETETMEIVLCALLF